MSKPPPKSKNNFCKEKIINQYLSRGKFIIILDKKIKNKRLPNIMCRVKKEIRRIGIEIGITNHANK